MMRKDKIYVNVLLPQISCAEVISCEEERTEKSDTQTYHAGELQEDAWATEGCMKRVLWIWDKNSLDSCYCNSLLQLWNPQLKAAIELVKHLVMFAIPTKSDAEKASQQPLCTMVTCKSRSRMCLSTQTFFPMHTPDSKLPRLKATHTQRQHEDRMRANHVLHCFGTCFLVISRLLEGSSCLMWTPHIHMLSLCLNDFLVM